MSIFHDEEDGPFEPLPGIPEALPAGEKVLWQGRPSALALAINTFRIRWILAYFVGATIFRVANLSSNSAGFTEMNNAVISSVIFCAGAMVIIFAIAFAMSRATLFTITSNRVIIRHGVAIRKYVNAPFTTMKSAQLKLRSARIGDIALQFDGSAQPPYLHLWPFAKPFKFSSPEPMLRGVSDPQKVAQILGRAAFDRAPSEVQIALGDTTTSMATHMGAAGSASPT